MNMNSTWEAFNSYHSTHLTPCKFEYCLEQAEVNRPADDTCVALTLQTTWLNKTVRGPTFSCLCWWGKGSNDWGMARGALGHPTCLPSPLPGTVLLAEDAGGRRWVSLACLCGSCKAERSFKELLGGFEGGPRFKLLFSVSIRNYQDRGILIDSSIRNLPAFQPLPAHCLSHPDGTTNGATLVMSIVILDRCVTEWLQAGHSLWFHTGPHTCWAITVTSLSQGNHNLSLNHHMHKPV